MVSKNNKVIVCQHGARRRYAVPRMLYNNDRLEHFYTDSNSGSKLGCAASLLGRFAPKSIQRLGNRYINGISKSLINSSDVMYILELIQSLFMRKPKDIYLFLQRHKVLSNRMISWGLMESRIVYSMYHENLDFVRWSKSQGAKTVVDVYISPTTDIVMYNEYKKYPEWHLDKKRNLRSIEVELWKETANLADILICPSEWVANGVRQLTPESSHKIRIVPYGCSIDYQGRTNKPIVGRILFAGGDALRKGLNHLALAATILKNELPELDFRVAGAIDSNITQMESCKDLNFLGKLSSSQMKEEFLSADLFVLPSLSEGFAGVVAESIGAGCPVIVTKESGAPIENNREGMIISSRSHSELVESIRKIVTDRNLRNYYSDNCLKQVDFYSEREWAKRLIRVLDEL